MVRAAGWPGIVSGAMFCTMFTCFMLAVTRTTVANTLIVNSLYPVFAAILGWLVLARVAARLHLGRDRRGGRRHGLDVRRRTGSGLSGTLIAFGVPVAAAVNVVTLRKWGRNVDLAPAVLLGGVFSALITLPFALPFAGQRARSRVARRPRHVPARRALHDAGRREPPPAAGRGRAADAAGSGARPAVGMAGRRRDAGRGDPCRGAIVLLAIAGNEMIALYGPAKFRRVRAA